jgi:hypothetical protein
MTLSDLASIGTLISGVAVLVSLVYLAVQTRQNVRHTRALVQQARSMHAADMPLRTAENDSLAAIRLRGDDGDATLDRVAFSRYWLMRISIFWSWEDQFHQHRDGLLDASRFAGTVRVMELQFTTPGCRYVWKHARMGFGPDYQAFMDAIMNRTRATRFDPHEQWKTGIEAEFAEASV